MITNRGMHGAGDRVLIREALHEYWRSGVVRMSMACSFDNVLSLTIVRTCNFLYLKTRAHALTMNNGRTTCSRIVNSKRWRYFFVRLWPCSDNTSTIFLCPAIDAK